VSVTLTVILAYKISTAIAAAFAAATIVMVIVKLLTWTRVLESWSKKRQAVPSWDENKFLFALQDSLENHKYREILGVFDEVAGKLVGEVEAVEAEEIDPTLRKKHGEEKLLIMRC
jgi:hypothetical protein